MNQLTSQRIAQLVIEALERTAFVLAEPVDAERAAELPAVTCFSRIFYSGPDQGQLFLAASDGFIRELVSSLLGVEPEEVDPVSQGEDAIKELANIVGGSTVLELGGADCEYSLNLPELVEAPEMPEAGDRGAECFVESEGELLKVIWHPSDPSRSAAA